MPCPPPHTEPTLTLDNLTTVMDGVQDINNFADWLQIPESKRYQIQQQYDSVPRRKRAYMDCWLTHHPLPSWKMVSISLWDAAELGVLELVQKLYFKGEPYCVGMVK